MATLAPTSPDPQPDGHSLPRKLATAPEWQTFATVQPLFAADILWKVVDPERCNSAAAGDAKFEIYAMVKRFRIDMGLLLNGLPEDDISRHAFDLCVKELRRLLQFLESLVLEKVNSAEKLGEAVDIEERTEIEDKDDRLCSAPSPSPNWFFWKWFGHGQVDQPRPIPKSPEARGSTQPNRRSTSNPSETAPSNSPYKRLEALGKTIDSSSNHSDHLLKECIDFLKLDHTFEHFKEGASIASRLSKRLDGLSKTTRRSSIQAQTVAHTNWSSEKPWTMLRRLFILLLETTCRQHEARLRLNGFLLDDCSNSSPPIDMFMSSCPTSTYWQDCRCTPIQSTPMTSGDQDGRVPLSDVCEYIGDSTAKLPTRLLNIEFEEDVLLYRPIDHQVSTHAGQSSMVSFEELVDHQCFQPGGMFDVNDKAVLALSLGRCLVHLVQGPWLRRPWTGIDIQFLGRHDGVRDAWHPYVICPIADDTANKDFDPADLVPLLLSFARLLVELETGERVLADPALPTFEDDIVAIQEDKIDGRGREDYIRAIEGCFKVKAALHQSIKRERDPTVHQRLRYLTRRTIYDGIVSHLERNFNQIARRDRVVILREVNQGKPAPRFGIALAAETSPSEMPVETLLSNLSVPVARATVADVDSERSNVNQGVYPMFFDGESTTGSSSHAKHSEDEYTVGVVCAIGFEMSAVRYMLDREHPRRPVQHGDPNRYVLGELSGHKVVIACLPGTQGKGAAAIVAANMARTFPSLNLRLLVGIGGGVPSAKHDIRLGDVVVSMPDGMYGGVVQYDLGKDTESGFILKGFLQPPPSILRAAVEEMRSDHLLTPAQIDTAICTMVQKGQGLAVYRRPSAGLDKLFKPEYPHAPQQPDCGQCDAAAEVSRPPREAEAAMIHYGLIASGDRVMRSAARKNATGCEVGDILCFEMEAAGIMTEFPCLVVRGVSDYADSHKNDGWQHYAAAAAAGCAKELLSHVSPAKPGVGSRGWP